MAIGSDLFWRLFQVSGHIGAYLLYTDYLRLQQVSEAREENRGEELDGVELRHEAAPAVDDAR